MGDHAEDYPEDLKRKCPHQLNWTKSSALFHAQQVEGLEFNGSELQIGETGVNNDLLHMEQCREIECAMRFLAKEYDKIYFYKDNVLYMRAHYRNRELG